MPGAPYRIAFSYFGHDRFNDFVCYFCPIPSFSVPYMFGRCYWIKFLTTSFVPVSQSLEIAFTRYVPSAYSVVSQHAYMYRWRSLSLTLIVANKIALYS